MKIHQSIVSEIVRGMSEDMSCTFPNLRVAIEKQTQFTLRMLDQQGLAFATLVLPSIGKWFDHCLAAGRILPDRPLFCGRRGSSIFPKYQWYLWEKIFDDVGVLRELPDHHAVFCMRQVLTFAKKLNITCEKERTYDSTGTFEALEESMVRSWPCTWDDDSPIWGCPTGHPLTGDTDLDRHPDLFAESLHSDSASHLGGIPWEHFRRLCRRTIASWKDFNVYAIEPKHGPGAVADKIGLKYELQNYPRRLAAIFPPDWFASTDLFDRTVSDKEYGSVLHAVPKTQKGPRLIAAEPTAHQWIQGGIQKWMEEQIKSTALGLSIDFRNQSYSQALALESSLTGAYATIDLSEASDRLTTRLVEYVFQVNHNLLDALHACRTRFINIPGDLRREGTDRMMVLKKFSTMGSAVTFPVQTIVFTLLGHFALMCSDKDWDCSPDAMRARAYRIRVFGDDIIIDNNAYDFLVAILTSVGLKVNVDKSFSNGHFRESCGMDAFDGVDVTPAYIRSPYDSKKPESLASIIECSNNFHMKGMWRTADRILKTVPERERKLIATGRQDIWSLTLKTFSSGVDPSKKTRWNPELQRREILAMAFLSKETRIQGSGEAALLQYFTEDPSTTMLSEWSNGQSQRPRHSKKTRWVKES